MLTNSFKTSDQTSARPVPDLSYALMSVLHRALTEVGGVRGSVVLIDPSREELVILAKVDPDGIWPPPDQKVRLKFRVGEGIAGHVAQTGQTHYAPIASQDHHFIPPTARPTGSWSLLAVPIVALNQEQNRVLGVISLEGPEGSPDFFGPEAVDRISALAVEAVTSIEAATWQALIQSTILSYRLLRIQAVSQALVSQQTLKEILEQIARIAFEELQADILTVYTWDEAKQDFNTPPIKLGDFLVPEAMGTPIHKGDVVDRVFHDWGSQFFQDIVHDPMFLSLGRVPSRNGQPERERFPVREQVKSTAILRLEVGAKRVGVLCVNWRHVRFFDDAERDILKIFANHVAIAIENARLMRLAVGEAAAAQQERLHRDLHDWIGGNLSAISHQVAACKNYLQQNEMPKANESFTEIEVITAEAVRGVRALLADLQPLTDLNLETALRRLCIDQQTQQSSIRLSISGPVNQLRKGVSEHIFRIAREAVLNAKRHGRAPEIQIALSVSREALDLDVTDNGKGGVLIPPAERKGKQKFGLSIMEQLAFVLGGQLTVGPRTEAEGWRVSLHIDAPLRAEAE